MFFKKGRKEEKTEKKALLMRENICVNCEPDTQEAVIRKVGQMLVNAGYVKQSYVGECWREKNHFPPLWETALRCRMVLRKPKKKYYPRGLPF